MEIDLICHDKGSELKSRVTHCSLSQGSTSCLRHIWAALNEMLLHQKMYKGELSSLPLTLRLEISSPCIHCYLHISKPFSVPNGFRTLHKISTAWRISVLGRWKPSVAAIPAFQLVSSLPCHIPEMLPFYLGCPQVRLLCTLCLLQELVWWHVTLVSEQRLRNPWESQWYSKGKDTQHCDYVWLLQISSYILMKKGVWDCRESCATVRGWVSDLLFLWFTHMDWGWKS